MYYIFVKNLLFRFSCDTIKLIFYIFERDWFDMSRKGREYSSTGIYHVLFRSVKSDSFFRREEDYKKFYDMIYTLKEECGFMLYAYSLMPDEIRLVIKVGDVSLESITKRISVKYAYWYNLKYARSGALFFDRFMSEPIESDEKFDEVYRFVLKRPEQLGIIDDYKEYRYSSIGEKMDVYKKVNAAFMKKDATESLTVKAQPKRITDEAAEEIILSVMGMDSLEEVKELDAKEKYKSVKKLVAKGVGYRQLARLCNMNYISIKKHEEDVEEVKKAPAKKAPAKKAPAKKPVEKKPVEKKAPVKKAPTTEKKEEKKEVIDFFLL